MTLFVDQNRREKLRKQTIKQSKREAKIERHSRPKGEKSRKTLENRCLTDIADPKVRKREKKNRRIEIGY